MGITKKIILSMISSCASISALAGNVSPITYQGRILTPDGKSLEVPTNFRFTIKAPNGCVLWEEDQTIDMTGSRGAFSALVGSGTNSSSGSHTFTDVFNNSRTLTGLGGTACASPFEYAPALTDDRTLEVSFNDGTGPNSLPAMPIKNVPFSVFSNYAQEVLRFFGKSFGGSAPTTNGQTLVYNQAQDRWEVGSAVAGGTVTFVDVALGGGLYTMTGGPVTTSGTISGTLANQNANLVFAGPSTGGPSAPTFRTLGTLDIPNLPASKITSGTLATAVIGVVPGANGGTVTQVDTGAGLVGGPINTSGTISLGTSGVAPGSYGSASWIPTFIVDAYGRLTGAGSAAISINASQVSGGTLSSTLLPTSGVTAGTFGSGTHIPTLGIDAYGRVTSAGSVAVNSSQWSNNSTGIHYNSGSVGIGTASPEGVLHVHSTNAIGFRVSNSNSNTNMQIANYSGTLSTNNIVSFIANRGSTGSPSAVFSEDVLGTMNFWGNFGGGGIAQGASIAAVANQSYSFNNYGTYLSFYTTADNQGFLSERMRLTGNGALAIGTTAVNSGSALEVSGGAIRTANRNEVRFSELASQGNNFVGFRALGTLGANFVWNLPSGDGSSGQVLTTNGSGDLSWASSTSDGSVLRAASGTAASPGISFLADQDTGLFNPGANTLAISTNGTQRIAFDGLGNMTFNATSNIYFDNAGNMSLGSNSTSIADLYVQRYDKSSTFLIENGSSSAARHPGILIQNYNGGFGGGPRVSGQAYRGNSGAPAAIQAGDLLLRLESRGATGAGYNVLNSGQVDFVAEQNFGAAAAGTNLQFKTAGNGGTLAIERMRITANGSVGIGTSTPTQQLDVMGGLALSGLGTTAFLPPSSGNYTMRLPSTIGSPGQTLLTDGTGNLSWGSPSGTTQWTTASGNIHFASGSVGIGTSTITNRLTVNGGIDFANQTDRIRINGNNAFQIRDDNTSTPTNLFVGTNREHSAFVNGTAAANVFLGHRAGENITTGSSNIGIGLEANTNTTTGYSNISIGSYAGRGITTGFNNISIGAEASNSNTIGSDNIVLGMETFSQNLTGSGNVAIGHFAGGTWSNPTGQLAFNTIIGDNAARSLAGAGPGAGAERNIIIGYRSGNNLTTGDGNIFIGQDTQAMSATQEYTLNIGNLIFGDRLDGTGTTVSNGSVGVGINTPSQRLAVGGGLALSSSGTASLLPPLSGINAWRLPSSAGAVGQVLVLEGAGTLGWASTPSSGGTFLAASGSAATPGFAFNSDPDTGLWNPGANTFAISTGGTNAITINNLGNIGIGTTVNDAFRMNIDGNVVSTGVLTGSSGVNGSTWTGAPYASTSSSSDVPNLAVHSSNTWGSTGSAAGYQMIARNNAGTYVHGYIAAVTVNAGLTPEIVIGQQTGTTAYAERVRINTGGSMGIGTTTPLALLDVSGSARFASATFAGAGTASLLAPVSGNNSWILPSTAGSSGQVLGLNGLGTLGWVSAPVNGGILLAADGSAGTPGISFNADQDTGMYRTGNNSIGFATNGANRVIIDNNGLGIGTAPSVPLHVSAASGEVLRLESASSAPAVIRLAGYDSGSAYRESYLSLTPVTGTNQSYFAIGNNSGDPFTFRMNGQMGVGTTNVSAGTGLEVNTGAIKAANGNQFRFGETLPNGTNWISLQSPAALASNYSLILPDTVGSNGQVLSNVAAGSLGWVSVPANGGTFLAASGSAGTPGFAFNTDPDTGLWNPGANTLAISTAGTTRITFDHLGNAGFGTSSPNYRLDVQATNEPLRVKRSDVPYGGSHDTLILEVANPSGAGAAGFGASIQFNGESSTTEGRDMAVIDSIWEDATDASRSSTLRFGTVRNGGVSEERMRITSLGQVGISSPGYMADNKLEVYGGAIMALPQGSLANQAGEYRFAELFSGGTNWIGMRSPDTIAANYTMVLPTSIGTSGQVLATDGTGALSWVSVPVAGGTFLAANGSAGTPSFSFSSDPDSGMYRIGANTLGFATGGTTRMAIGNNGNVGIGTSTPQFDMHIQKNYTYGIAYAVQNTNSGTLAQAGYLAVNDAGYGGGILATSSTFNVPTNIVGIPSNANLLTFSAVNGSTPTTMAIGTEGNRPLHFYTNNIARQTITNGGSFGFGTIAPSAFFDVVGDFRFSHTATATAGGWHQPNNVLLDVNPGGASAADFHGIASTLTMSGANTKNAGAAVFGRFNVQGNGAVTYGRNFYGYGEVAGANVSEFSGFQSALVVSSNRTVNDYASFYASTPSLSGTIGNSYGVRIADQLGNNQWGIYQEGANDRSYFAGSLGVGVTSPIAKLDVQGAAGGSHNARLGATDSPGILNVGYNNEMWTDQGINGGASLDINYRGYNGGFTQPRSFQIFNGQGTIMASFAGATGNVAIGTTASASNTKLYVAGQIASASGSNTDGAIDFSLGNSITSSFDCGSALTLANIRNGGTYVLVITGAGTTTCNFPASTSGDDGGAVTYKWQTLNGTRSASSHTMYTLVRIGSVIYVSWATGFQ